MIAQKGGKSVEKKNHLKNSPLTQVVVEIQFPNVRDLSI